MSKFITTTIAIAREPEAQSLKEKLDPEASPEILRLQKVVLEYSRDEMRSMLFLALYMPANLVAAYGGIQSIVPGIAGDDVLSEHGMRLCFQQLDTKAGILGFDHQEKTQLTETEMSVIREALRKLMSEDAADS